jgi:hypothetical protein
MRLLHRVCRGKSPFAARSRDWKRGHLSDLQLFTAVYRLGRCGLLMSGGQEVTRPAMPLQDLGSSGFRDFAVISGMARSPVH